MIYQTAYDTTACAALRMKETLENLQRARISGAVREVSIPTSHDPQGVHLCLLEGGNAGADVVAYFNHPLRMSSPKDDEVVLAVDVRNFGKWSQPHSAYVVRNRTEYLWSISRATLNAAWMQGAVETIRDISTVPMAVYCDLIAQVVQRRFALDNAERLQVQAVAAYFYQCLFTDATEFSQMQMSKMMGLIAQVTRIPVQTVMNWLEEMPPIRDIHGFCQACKSLTGSVALSDFNVRVLLEIVGGTWFGTNSREIIAVALEHPPTWVMIVTASLTEVTFMRSTLATISKRYDKGSAVKDLVRALSGLTGTPQMLQRLESGDFVMEGFIDTVKRSAQAIKVMLSTPSKKASRAEQDEYGDLRYSDKLLKAVRYNSQQLTKEVRNIIERTYGNPAWVEHNVSGQGSTAQHKNFSTLFEGGKPVEPNKLKEAYAKSLKVLDRIRDTEKPFIKTRLDVFKEVSKFTGRDAEKLEQQVRELYEKHAESLNSHIEDRIDPKVAEQTAIACAGAMFNLKRPDYLYGHTLYSSNASDYQYPVPTKATAQQYVQALYDLIDLQDEVGKRLQDESIQIPYFEFLPEFFWDVLEDTRWFNLYLDNVTCTQSREEVYDLYLNLGSNISMAILALYYLLFNV